MRVEAPSARGGLDLCSRRGGRRDRVIHRIGRALLAVVVLGLIAAACGPPTAPPLGRPALRQTPAAPRVFDNSDPAVLVDGGAVYLFGSTNNRWVPVRRITSFGATLAQSQQQWAQSPRDAMPALPAWVDPAERQIWAPTLIKLGSKYVMWFAAAHAGARDEANDQCIGRAEATTVTGPYIPASAPMYCGLPPEGAGGGLPASNPWGRGALDPQVLRGADGNLYLVVALSRTGANIGGLRLDSLGRVIGGANATPSTLASQAYPWHDGTDDGTMGSGAFLENPTMIYEPATRTYLLFYSAGQWYSSRYVTGFGRCATPIGPCRLDSRGPMLMSGNGRSGVGGLTAFRDVNGTTLRVAYASWQAGREGQSGSVGEYSRQTHWGTIALSAGSDPSTQSVAIA